MVVVGPQLTKLFHIPLGNTADCLHYLNRSTMLFMMNLKMSSLHLDTLRS